jgi:hypothetical protein
MRHLVLAMLVLFSTFGGSRLARADDSEHVVIDATIQFSPGQMLRECFDTDAETTITVAASSPPGRTGETARLLFMEQRETARPNVYLSAELSLDDLVAGYRAAPGTYCYQITVTDTPALWPARAQHDPADPERKAVHLMVVTSPS